ncbi:MAG: ribosome silencing factor [Synergistetes bacterium]|nr:MAG: Ribosomal silencing factor RsfS [bacterium 42_11]MBC7332233.1 ribosome silencing factor [Synergistota bacterium]MDK2871950.1 ribosome-associated protein [bacterium]
MKFPTKDLLKKIVNLLEQHKAEDIVVLDLSELSYVTDFFVICTGRSETHLEALAEELEFGLKREGIMVWGVEGRKGGRWILLDYGDIVVHIFTPEGRLFFDLERIWNQARKVEPHSL